MGFLLAPLLLATGQARRILERSYFSIDVVAKSLGLGQTLYFGYTGEEDVERFRIGFDRDRVGTGFDGCSQGIGAGRY